MTTEKERRFRELVDSQKDRVFRLCCCYVRGDEARKDVYQEVLIQLWRGLDTFQGKSSLATWVYRVAVNTCLAYLRGERRRTRLLDPETRADRQPAAAEDGPASVAEHDDDVRRLYACVNELPVADRMLVSLYLEDADTAEMAGVLGISEGNVRVRLHRIRKELKDIWERRNHGPA